MQDSMSKEHQNGIAADPALLKNMINSRPAPVIVPRSNNGHYYGVVKQGLDRAINYINYD